MEPYVKVLSVGGFDICDNAISLIPSTEQRFLKTTGMKYQKSCQDSNMTISWDTFRSLWIVDSMTQTRREEID
eukprot:5055439-Ditylum_brightwellii.AAC.1